MAVVNKTYLGKDLSKRSLGYVDKLVIHRIEDGGNADEIADFFKKNPAWTNGKMGYSFIITEDGTTEQAAALNRKACGALRLNQTGIQIGVIGDFRKHPPTHMQLLSLVNLCTLLTEWIGPARAKIVGHTSIKGASADPNKVCPGKFLDVEKLALTVKRACRGFTKQSIEKEMLQQGFVLED